MLRWVPCLGSPSPVDAGIWSALRTSGSRLMNCWATRTCPPAIGSRPMLRRGLLLWNHLDVELIELLRIDLCGSSQHQVGHRLGLRKSDHVPDVVRPAKHHHDAVDAG